MGRRCRSGAARVESTPEQALAHGQEALRESPRESKFARTYNDDRGSLQL